MKDGTSDDAEIKSSEIVTELVGKEADNGRSDKHTEGENGIHEGDVHVVDADILHVDCEVWHDGEGSSVEEKQCEFQRQQVHVGMEKILCIGTCPFTK